MGNTDHVHLEQPNGIGGHTEPTVRPPCIEGEWTLGSHPNVSEVLACTNLGGNKSALEVPTLDIRYEFDDDPSKLKYVSEGSH